MRSSVYLTLCLLVLASGACAQQQASLRSSNAPGDELFVVRHQVAEVAVQLTVIDRRGRTVSGIRPEDLVVLDNNQPVPEMTRLGYSDDLPLHVAMVMDWSDSMQKSFAMEQEGAKDFLRTALRPNIDQALVIGFRSKPQVTQGLTDEIKKLETGIRPVAGARVTALYDAVVAGCAELKKGAGAEPQRRVLVLLTDGGDNYSMAGMEEAIEAAQRDGVMIYAISPRRASRDNSGILTALTTGTGGRAFTFSKKPGTGFQQIEAELHSGYWLYFKPIPAPTEAFHQLQIRARDRKLQVRARTAYYARGE